MNKTFISIGIPFYNSEKYLEMAINSVINQSYPYWELILLDDGSSDNSLHIAEKFASQDERIKVISDGKNLKLPTRLNQLVDESKYEYFARMDADDIMHPLRLETQIDFLLKNGSIDLVGSGIISIDSLNQVKGYRTVEGIFTDFSTVKMSGYPITHPTILGKKSWFIRNRYSSEYPRTEDFELWCRAISKNDFKIAILPDLLLFYREEGNLSIKKILDSYSYKIVSKYTNYSLFELLKLTIKKLGVTMFFLTGNLQKLSRRRYRLFVNNELSQKYQDILNKSIISKR
ncbi:glycosyltransferase [Glaesserella parasuis]|uniref:glycosyltransferase family 2 protein n=1 Tax=Glaesserella parasuis TaxID=738 RepID=UPI0013654090|nr:glycosyltransferase [Glaesserella parasuis]MCT8824063.1 glycosyltransferase [Glaesserella parasuis]MWQ13474.1 glycosyltransferase [Glaesserella parasuis]